MLRIDAEVKEGTDGWVDLRTDKLVSFPFPHPIAGRLVLDLRSIQSEDSWVWAGLLHMLGTTLLFQVVNVIVVTFMRPLGTFGGRKGLGDGPA